MIDADEIAVDDQEIKVVGATKKLAMKAEDYTSNEGWKKNRKSWHEVA